MRVTLVTGLPGTKVEETDNGIKSAQVLWVLFTMAHSVFDGRSAEIMAQDFVALFGDADMRGGTTKGRTMSCVLTGTKHETRCTRHQARPLSQTPHTGHHTDITLTESHNPLIMLHSPPQTSSSGPSPKRQVRPLVLPTPPTISWSTTLCRCQDWRKPTN